ncbi:hypothetical protein [Deinococcus wulumuqiensis]|uniref:Uncharacterized protein n=1 Tax=Deinococcus wulumuqiensis TaxID=980427 RepID=A0AAV4KA31_9DEIO|nr:hypothetical protein [Deinococcus wulumuqiensis]QII21190.1 hypothetical protein G6R31_10880 [Deinococcus wulumuqiensis R12]GGI83348.1 hypothetical protein GCM10010914_17000 [Deinococcus wulumuqiensis]GGP29664.1 hypothetical protein GCM10008021_13150 [Deinococcus wulumuqiensis]
MNVLLWFALLMLVLGILIFRALGRTARPRVPVRGKRGAGDMEMANVFLFSAADTSASCDMSQGSAGSCDTGSS